MANHLFHEGSNYCIIPKKWRIFTDILDKDKDGQVSQSEITNAVTILEKARIQHHKLNYLRYGQ